MRTMAAIGADMDAGGRDVERGVELLTSSELSYTTLSNEV